MKISEYCDELKNYKEWYKNHYPSTGIPDKDYEIMFLSEKGYKFDYSSYGFFVKYKGSKIHDVNILGCPEQTEFVKEHNRKIYEQQAIDTASAHYRANN